MNRKLFAILISLILSTTYIPFAHSAVVAGAPCKKIGLKSFVNNKDFVFTCIKSGKKLVWNKGASTVKKEVVKEKKWEQDYKNINSQLNKLKGEGLKIEAIYSPTVNMDKAKEILNNFSESVQLYSPFIGIYRNVALVFMSEKDTEFYKQQVLNFEGPNGDSSFMTGTHCQVSSNNYCAYGSNRVSSKIVFYQFIGSESKFWNSKSVKISNYHEAVHMYQNSLSSENMYAFMPPWFIEGQAVFLGYASILNFASIKDVSDLKDGSKRGLLNSIPSLLNLSSSQIIGLLRQFESDITYVTSKSLGYDLGHIICEYLYFNFGPETINKLILNVNLSRNWHFGVKQSLGVDTQELYEKVSIYILNQINS